MISLRVAIRIIEELTKVSEVSLAAKAIYVESMVNQVPGIQWLATKTGKSRKTVVKLCKSLEQLGWLQLVRKSGRVRPVAVLPAETEGIIASQVRDLVSMSIYKGEETTKAFLDWTVAPTVNLVYNARPSFLLNPDTGQNLEYDVYAPELMWAVEYQGDQHFGPTTHYPGEKQFIERYRRDVLKDQLSRQHKVRLSLVTKHDLTLARILEAIPANIPRRTVDSNGPFVQMLERLGREVAGKRGDWDRE